MSVNRYTCAFVCGLCRVCVRERVLVHVCVHPCVCMCVCVFLHAPMSIQYLLDHHRNSTKVSGDPRKAACLRPLPSLPPGTKPRNRQGGRAERQEEQRGMSKVELSPKPPGFTSKLQPLKLPVAGAFGTAPLPDCAGIPLG